MFAARQQLGLELITMQLNNTINAIKITIKHAAYPALVRALPLQLFRHFPIKPPTSQPAIPQQTNNIEI